MQPLQLKAADPSGLKLLEEQVEHMAEQTPDVQLWHHLLPAKAFHALCFHNLRMQR